MKTEWIRFYIFLITCFVLALISGYFMFAAIDLHFQTMIYHSSIHDIKLSNVSNLFSGILVNEYGSYVKEVYLILSFAFMNLFILKTLPEQNIRSLMYAFVQAFMLFICISIAIYSFFHFVVSSSFGFIFIPMGAPDDARFPLVSYLIQPARILVLFACIFTAVKLYNKIRIIPNHALDPTSGNARGASPEAGQG